MSIAITSSNFVCVVFCEALKRFILCPLFLIYIKSNHIVSTVKQLSADVYYFPLLYARTLAGKLNPDLKANLNGHPSMCHLIQI